MSVNQTITALDLSNNYINEEGGKHLGLMLKANHSLKHLNLERNSLGDEGVQVLSSFVEELAYVIMSLTELFTLRVSAKVSRRTLRWRSSA